MNATLLLLLLQRVVTIAGGGAGDGGPALQANLAGPEGVAVDRAGNIYIADSSNHRIRHVAPDGRIHTVETPHGVLKFPVGVAVDSAGRLYIADTYHNRVLLPDRAVGGFNMPAGLAIDGAGRIFVADSGSGRILRVDSEHLEPVAQGLGRILSLAFSPQGELHFTEQDRNRVRKINRDGELITVAGMGLSRPFGIAFDAGGALLIADEGNNRIVRVPVSGEPAVVASGLQSPQGIAVDSHGNILAAQFEGNRIAIIREDGTWSTIAGNGEAFFSGDGGNAVNAALNLPQGIFVDEQMNLWIADRENNRIRRVAPDGKISTVAGKVALLRPSAVIVDGRGNAMVADTGHHVVLRISKTGAVSTVAGTRVAGFGGDGGLAVNALLHLPTALAFHRNGDLLVGDSGNHRIRAISPDGTIRTIHAGNYEPSALASDIAGNLYIADRSNGVVLKALPDGGTVRVASGLRHPQGLAVDAAGSLYVADTDSHQVVRLQTRGPMPIAVEGLSGPHGLAFDRKGNLLIADSRNHRIVMVSDLPAAPSASLLSATVAPVPVRAVTEGESRSLAPFVPTPVPVIERMLEMARVRKGDVVYDLGSGDGRIPILAALRYGVNAVGIEIEHDLTESARKRISELKLEGRVRIVEGDALQADLSSATVVTVYLLPEYMPQLAAALKKSLRPGARIVSHDATFEGWRPAETATVPGETGRVHNLYLYINR